MANTNNTIFIDYRIVNGQEIEIECYYTLGGVNYITGNTNPRGYILVARKIERRGDCIIRTLSYGSGDKNSVCELLVECKRKGGKAASNSLTMITEDKINEMIKYLMS